MAYTIQKKLFGDALSDTYDVVDNESGIHYNMTEYYVEDTLNQTDSAAQKFLNLYRGLWTLKNISLRYLPKIDTIEASNSVIIIWESLYGMSLKEYMQSYNARISYRVLLNVLSPLMDDCETAHQNGIYFSISPETIFLTDGGVLKLNTLVNPSANIYTVCMGVAQSIFYMLTGFPYGNVQIPIDVYIPNRLWQLLYEVLTWRREFGSIGEFHNAIRMAIRASENEAMGLANPVAAGKKKPSGTFTAAGIGIGCFTILVVVFVLIVVGVIKFPAQVNTESSNITQYSETPAAAAQSNSPFKSASFGYAYFNPDNASEIFDGMVLQTDSGLFYRRKTGSSAQLVKETGNDETVLLSGVLPSFIQADGKTVYFCDGYKDYIIRSYDGNTLKDLVNDTAGYLRLYNNYLYYINDDDHGSIYMLDTQTGDTAKINDEASYDLTIVGSRLYYVNIYDDYAIYYISLDDGAPACLPLRLANGGGVRGYELKNLKGNLIYCRDSDWQLCVITSDNTETPFIYPVAEYTYDVYGDDLYYLDDTNYNPHQLLITGGGKDAVISSEECSYITAVNGGAFFVSDQSGYALCRIKGGKREVVDIIGP